MENEKRTLYKDVLLSLVPKDKSIGNVSLIEKFKKKTKELSEDIYWEIRNELIEEGKLSKGKGRGGSVYHFENLLNSKIKKTKSRATSKKLEQALYKPFAETLHNFWTKDNDVKNYILQITANQGSRDTGGKWTRPDLTIIDVKAFSFFPTKLIEVTTFELKPEGNYGIEGVFETAAHSIFAHKSYLAIHYSKENYDDDDELIETIRKRCEMFGVGLILFKEPSDWKSVTTVLEARHNNPDPSEVNKFIRQQINQDNQHQLLEKLK